MAPFQNTPKGLELLDGLQKGFAHFISYTAYFNATISQNVSRELRPINLIDIVNKFSSTILEDARKQGIDIKVDNYGYNLITIPMHTSEWTSMLFNLYTNSKKAIKRANSTGMISIIIGEEGKNVYLEFSDNGDGIPDENKERIFNAFFTTSTPAGFEAPTDERLVGTGLGLKIVKDMVETYGGRIYLLPPETGFTTCFRIEVPKSSPKQLTEYGL